jgi:hypothetical protein
MSKRKNVHVIVTTESTLATKEVPYVSGWGENAKAFRVDGDVMKIDINDDVGKGLVSFVIREDGSLIVTNYQGVYSLFLGSNVRLENVMPWSETQTGADKC